MPQVKPEYSSHTLQVSPGRKLGYCDLGPRDGIPVFLFHGNPGSRLQIPADIDTLERLGVRLITADRPGFGLSSPQPMRKILDWPEQIEQLANHLDIETFIVVGVSAGSPYALACAYRLPNRVVNVGCVSGMTPAHKIGSLQRMPLHHSTALLAAKHMPWLFQGSMMLLQWGFSLWPNTVFNELKNHAPECDKRVLANPDVHHLMLRDFKEAFSQGSTGVESEMRCLSENWRFSLNFVECPVDIYHGTHDETVTLAMAKHMAAKLPRKQLHVMQGEGHFLMFKHWESILQGLIESFHAEQKLMQTAPE